MEKNLTAKYNQAKDFVQISRQNFVISHQFWLNGIFPRDIRS